MDLKAESAEYSIPMREDEVNSGVVTEKLGTAADQADMYRMGKEPKLRRNFGFFSIFGFSMILLSTWESIIGAAIFGLENGGTAGLIYTYIVCSVGFAAVVLSMAEMSSMAPTAGGQYHWVSEFAPLSTQRFLSYVVGWLCVLGWQTGSAASAFLAAQEVQGLVILNHEDYDAFTWRLVLMAFAIAFICGFFNTFLARRLPLIEGCVLFLHILGFFAILISLWVLAPRAKAKDVFTTFQNNGWSSNGISTLVGIITPTVSLIGSDAACHMSEELLDASYTLPRAMIATAVTNAILGFVMLVTVLFCIGNLDAVLSSPVGESGVPFIQVFADGVQSNGGATGMTAILIILSIFCCITNMAAASRQLYAFSRDRGVPFSRFLSLIPQSMPIPVPAIGFTILVTMLLALIPLGSSIAYNNITSLGLGALLSSYIICISCVLLRRIRGQKLLPRRFSLGNVGGLLINAFALCFLALTLVLCFFPATPNPTLAEMNWAVVIYGGVIVIAFLYFMFKGRKEYKGPVEYVRKLD